MDKIGGSCKLSDQDRGLCRIKQNEHAVDAQWTSFSAQGTGVGALKVLEHAISIGDEIGRHLDPVSDGRTQESAMRTGGDCWKRVIFH